MEKKGLTFKIKGMLRDTDISNLNNEYSFENKNIRITVREDHTLLGVTNEKGTSKVLFDYDIDSTFGGTMMGYCVLNNIVTVFFHNDDASISNSKRDSIHTITYNSGSIIRNVLYIGNLNFNTKFPIETIGIYETENIQKVYWTDGLNQPRVINISLGSVSTYIDTSFDFSPTMQLNEQVSISRIDNSNGLFPAGIIQYSFTYYNKYGQESNIFYTSPLYYISEIDRGGAANATCTSCFKIDVTEADINFDYIRVYSMIRTSLDTTPVVKRVRDFKINRTSPSTVYSFIDDGRLGEDVDSTKLLYTGSQNIVAETFTHKDNTLFLGNIKLNTKVIPESIRELFKSEKWSLKYGYKDVSTSRINNSLANDTLGYYNYDNQLKHNAQNITTFKFLEYYRFGLQFQYSDGAWSEVLFLKDMENTLNPNGTNTISNAGTNDFRLIGASMFITRNMVHAFIDAGFKRVRPVIVYPSIYDRECLCQGILCPTVYNYEDRYHNSPFAQSSWFGRAYAPYDFSKSIKDTLFHSDIKDRDLGFLISPFHNSRMAIVLNDYYRSIHINNVDCYYVLENGSLVAKPEPGGKEIVSNTAKDGSVIEFRHNHPLSGRTYSGNSIYKGKKSYDSGGELQQWYKTLQTSADREPYLGISLYSTQEAFDIGVKAFIAKAGERFAVDQSILTFHSPDLEFDPYISTLDLSKYKLRIVGHVPMTSFISDIDIQTSTPPNIKNVPKKPIKFSQYKVQMPGFRKYNVGVNGISRYGYRGLSSGIFWFDDLSSYNDGKYCDPDYIYGFNIYPWHRNGSLNNQGTSDDGNKTAMLKYKKMSNLRFSYNSRYFSQYDVWYAEIAGSSYSTGLSDIQLFNSDEVSNIKLKAPGWSHLKAINYYGNVDKILTTKNPLQITDIAASNSTDKVDVVGYDITASMYLYKYDENRRVNGGLSNIGLYETPFYNATDILDASSSPYLLTSQSYGTDPIYMRYKSTKHAVLVFNYTLDGMQRYAPIFQDGNRDTNETWIVNSSSFSGARAFWDFNTTTSTTNVIIFDSSYTSQLSANGMGPEYGFYWLAELYNDATINRFGGDGNDASINNTWLPCGDSTKVQLNTYSDPFGEQYYGMYLNWTEGDTYYQRYDHLKTYPFSLTDQNSVTDIISFMCETRINIDGRYDRNRGQISNLVMTPTNFNLLNMVYSQKNNYFTYNVLDYEKFSENNFPTTLCWSKEKSYGEDIDTWTNIQLSSSDILDGDKGAINALRTFNNEIYAFQDTGISNILFNSRVQIPTSDATPIEITNGLKYSGKKYFTSNTGCINKWSIIQTSGSVYFIDNNGSSMYAISGDGLKCITDLKGFKKWMSDNNSMEKWNPETFPNFRAFYDKSNNDIYFINNDTCLVYNEVLDCFTSFMNYEKVPCLFNELGNVYMYRDGNMWLMGGGNYNTFFNTVQPFYITYRVNPNSGTSVIFDNVEYQADSFNSNGVLVNSNFTQVDVWNEYQNATAQLNNQINHPSNLKDKFRVWRIILPRYGKDRIRNPWINLKLSMNDTKNVNKFILHSLTSVFYI